MNKKLIKIIVALMSLNILLTVSSFGQGRTVVVKDAEGNPIAGASVTVGEASKPVITNEKGEFEMQVLTRTPVLIEADGYSSQLISVTPATEMSSVTLVKTPYQMGDKDKVNMPFDVLKQRQLTGSVVALDPKQILSYDRGSSYAELMSGRLPFRPYAPNVLVDGIPRPATELNPEQIEQITYVKDLSSALLYGTQAQNGLILITTKRGQPLKKMVEFTGQTGLNKPISYPKFLGAVDYMNLYNEALANDGLAPKYNEEQIQKTGTDNVHFPDEDYYNSTYLKNLSTFHEVVGQASGGNDIAQYYLNVGWRRDNGILKLGEGANEHSDRLNMRGNVNYNLTDKIRIIFDGMAVFDISRDPRYSTANDFWMLSSTLRPNNTPVLIPVSLMKDKALLGAAKLIDNQYILGGTSQYQTNIYGELTKNGPRQTNSRIMELTTGLDFDLSSITPGLSASAKMSFDMYSTFYADIMNTYKTYATQWDEAADTITKWTPIGTDTKVADQTLSDMSFYRRIGLYGKIDYRRTFNDHQININAIGYRDQYSTENVIQFTKHLQFGVRANYMYQNKYIVELTGVESGSVKLFETDPWAFSPGVGVGWVLSEEDFLAGNSLVNYLKARANFAIVNTDESLTNYYLGRNLYSGSTTFYYNQQTNSNASRIVANGNPNVGFEKMMNINAGFESMLLDNKLGVDLSYFYYKNYDVITRRANLLPQYFIGLPYENFGASQYQGVELSLNYNTTIGDLGLNVGGYLTYSVPKALVVDEPNYKESYHKIAGKESDAIIGYVADGLFSSQAEIDASPYQTFGTVQPGDIKYKDLNDDGIIDDRDQKIIGNYSSRLSTGLNVRLSYKNFELFAMGYSGSGSERFYNSAYYWVYGDRKYSDVVWDRWTPATAATATYPRLTSLSNSNNFRNSTFWLYTNNYFDLQTAQLSYTLPVKVASFDGIRVYVRGTNLVRISKNKDRSELNVGTAPQMRAVSFGLNVML